MQQEGDRERARRESWGRLKVSGDSIKKLCKKKKKKAQRKSENLEERRKAIRSKISMKRAGFNVMVRKHACNGFYW